MDSCFLGPSGLESGLLGCMWGLPSWNLVFGGLLRLNLNTCCFLGLFVFCCTVVAYLPTNLFTLSAHLLINTVSCHARRSISHKEIPQDKSKRRRKKQTNERKNKRTNERANERTDQNNKQAHKKSTQRTSERKNERADEHTNKRSCNRRAKQANKQPNKQANASNKQASK